MFNSHIFWKIYFYFILFIVLTGLVVGIFVAHEIQQDELHQTEQKLTAYAKLLSGISPEQLQEFSLSQRERVRDLHNNLGVRLTVIKSNGEVVADSDEDFSKMDNHGDRPEVIQARENGKGVVTRFSNTVKKNMMNVALPIVSEGKIIGYSRASFPLSDMGASRKRAFISGRRRKRSLYQSDGLSQYSVANRQSDGGKRLDERRAGDLLFGKI